MVIEKIKYGRGRPKKGEIRPGKKPVKETVGRPIGRVQKAPGASFSLGKSYIDLLSTISDDLQETRSAIIKIAPKTIGRAVATRFLEVDRKPLASSNFVATASLVTQTANHGRFQRFDFADGAL